MERRLFSYVIPCFVLLSCSLSGEQDASEKIEALKIDSSTELEFKFGFYSMICPNETEIDGTVNYVFNNFVERGDSTTFYFDGEFVGQKVFCCNDDREEIVTDFVSRDRLEISRTDNSMYFVFSPNGHIMGPVPRYVEMEGDSLQARAGHEVRDARWSARIVEGIGLRFLGGGFDPSICTAESYWITALDYVPSPW